MAKDGTTVLSIIIEPVLEFSTYFGYIFLTQASIGNYLNKKHQFKPNIIMSIMIEPELDFLNSPMHIEAGKSLQQILGLSLIKPFIGNM